MVVVKQFNRQKDFLQFNTLTLAPIEYNLINHNLLTDKEKKWLLNYHHKLLNRLQKSLKNYEIEYLQKYIEFYQNLSAVCINNF